MNISILKQIYIFPAVLTEYDEDFSQEAFKDLTFDEINKHEDRKEHHIHKCTTTVIKQNKKQNPEPKLKYDKLKLLPILMKMFMLRDSPKVSIELADEKEETEPLEEELGDPIVTRHIDIEDNTVKKCITTIIKMKHKKKRNLNSMENNFALKPLQWDE